MNRGELQQSGKALPEAFYARKTIEVAHELLGKVVVYRECAGRIVEVEAYLGVNDLAAHAAAGLTDRTRVLFGPPGRAYVYLIYGMYECLNFVAEADGAAGCVLIRALEPITGLDVMRSRRPAAKRDEDLCSGPGKLTRAMAITRELNGAKLTGPLSVHAPQRASRFEMATGTRIGITKCVDWPLRFWVKGSPFVSR